MELAQKGQSADVGSFNQLLCKMKWTTQADFDLAAVYENEDGSRDMVYFQKRGDLNSPPFIQLDQDSGVGDTGGDNEENLRITKLDGKKKIHLLAWDYGKVTKGEPARFSESDVHIEVMDDKGTTHDVKLDTGEAGNVAVMATIEVTPLGAKLINESKAGTLKSFSKLSQLTDIIDS